MQRENRNLNEKIFLIQDFSRKSKTRINSDKMNPGPHQNGMHQVIILSIRVD